MLKSHKIGFRNKVLLHSFMRAKEVRLKTRAFLGMKKLLLRYNKVRIFSMVRKSEALKREVERRRPKTNKTMSVRQNSSVSSLDTLTISYLNFLEKTNKDLKTKLSCEDLHLERN